MSDIVTPIDTLSNDNLKRRLASQIALEDWTDERSKCGYPKLLHKDHVLHGDATCTRGKEVPNILNENWKANTQRVKPILKMIREDTRKEMEKEGLLQGLREIIDSNTENIESLFQTVRKREHSPLVHSPPPRPAKLTKPAKVPSWTKDMSLETYVKQLTTW